jgi:hypothetical protein
MMREEYLELRDPYQRLRAYSGCGLDPPSLIAGQAGTRP